MPDEVKGPVAKLTTSFVWDKDEEKRVTVLRITVADITADQLRQLFLFQNTPALSFSITSAQASLFPIEGVTPAVEKPDLPLVKK